LLLTRHITPASAADPRLYKLLVIMDLPRGRSPKTGPGAAPQPPPSFYVSRKRAFFRKGVILVRMMIVTSPCITVAAARARGRGKTAMKLASQAQGAKRGGRRYKYHRARCAARPYRPGALTRRSLGYQSSPYRAGCRGAQHPGFSRRQPRTNQ